VTPRAPGRGARARVRRAPIAAAPVLVLVLAVVLSSIALTTPAAGKKPDGALTTIILVRHAEKDTLFLGTDPPLSRAGAVRARELARVLGETQVDALYVTEWRRNRETAEPLAAALGDTLRVLRGHDFAAQAELLASHRGQTVVVVGHGDTVPALYRALTGTEWRGYRGGEWDPILIVTLTPGGRSKTVTIKYGEPPPGP